MKESKMPDAEALFIAVGSLTLQNLRTNSQQNQIPKTKGASVDKNRHKQTRKPQTVVDSALFDNAFRDRLNDEDDMDPDDELLVALNLDDMDLDDIDDGMVSSTKQPNKTQNTKLIQTK